MTTETAEPEFEALKPDWQGIAGDTLHALKSIDGIAYITPVIEENGLIRYRDRQHLVTFKGVGNDYNLHTGIDSMMISGSFDLQYGNSPAAVAGAGVAYALSLSVNDSFNPLELYVPRKNAGNTLNPEEAFNSEVIFASGIFQIQPEFDNKYVILPIDFAAPLFDRESELTSLEIGLKKGFKSRLLQQKLSDALGANFVVKNRFEQHQLLYKIINAEKWAVYLILTFILIIATFNIIGSLTMLVVEKSDDIRVLSNLGASPALVRRIFFLEGLLISFTGCFMGLVLGFVAIFLQERYGLIWIVEDMPYPMLVKLRDVGFVVLTVLSIGALAAWYPAGKSVKRALKD
jgi:lipoprotein-releasing system permease protein